MKNIFAVANQKGGVGKTTTAAALVTGLIASKKSKVRVLAIDLDPQINLTFTFKAEAAGGKTILGVLTGEVAINDAIQHTEYGDIIPATHNLAGADFLLAKMQDPFPLRTKLATLSDAYDYVVIDCPPSLDMLTMNALVSATDMVIPAEADVFSMSGIGQLADTVNAVRTRYGNPALHIAGILLTKYKPRMTLTKDMESLMQAQAEKIGTKVFQSKIREGVAVREAHAMQQGLLMYAPKSNPAVDYKAFVKELLKR